MPQFRLNRRAVLRGAGGVAIALPWLELMGPARSAEAAAPPAKKFVGIYTPGGTELDRWRPTGTETDFTLSRILQPLAPVKQHVMVVDGIDMTCAVGEQNQAGQCAHARLPRSRARGGGNERSFTLEINARARNANTHVRNIDECLFSNVARIFDERDAFRSLTEPWASSSRCC